MTKVARRGIGAQSAGVVQCRADTTHKIAETRILPADEAPQQTESHQSENGVAAQQVEFKEFIFQFATQPLKTHQGNQAPVKQPGRPIPDVDFVHDPRSFNLKKPLNRKGRNGTQWNSET